MTPLPRRVFVTALTVASAAPAWAGSSLDGQFAALEKGVGGRIGVAALDLATGGRVAYRTDERFAMASTFKLSLAACVLRLVDRGTLRIDQMVPYGKADLLPHAPVTAAHVRDGRLSLAQLAEAAVEVSDNGAANLLLRLIGGPAALTAFWRGIGDGTTRLDRTEMALNSNIAGDARDTTSPAAMLASMQTMLLGTVLSEASRGRLIGWMKGCTTGTARLRAGLPAGWVAGDKTGSGENGAINDLVIAWPGPGLGPILIVCYMSGSKAPIEQLSAAHERVGAMVAARFA